MKKVKTFLKSTSKKRLETLKFISDKNLLLTSVIKLLCNCTFLILYKIQVDVIESKILNNKEKCN